MDYDVDLAPARTSSTSSSSGSRDSSSRIFLRNPESRTHRSVLASIASSTVNRRSRRSSAVPTHHETRVASGCLPLCSSANR